MSNGSRSCPPVTLPFGVFPAKETICPLEPGDFPGPDPPPCLEDFISANSPTDATGLDGFDEYFADTTAVVDALDTALNSLGADLFNSFAEADTIDAAPVAATAAGFTASLEPSSKAVNDLGTLLGSVAAPAPGAGAGAGSPSPTGGDIGPTGPCDECIELSPAAAGAPAVTYKLSYQNQLNGPLTVSSVSLQQGTPAVFSVQASVPATVPETGSLPINIIVAAPQSNTFHALLTIRSTQGTGTTVACIKVAVSPDGSQVPAPSAELCGGGAAGGGGTKVKPE